MEALHLVYQHWFITCLLVLAVGDAIGAARGK